ncbi:MAG: glycosyltransferase [Acidimicrobiales bacterium]|jgi:hypothetical protein|nr:glycosyltransferase [Acidimicrobiales bacterium]
MDSQTPLSVIVPVRQPDDDVRRVVTRLATTKREGDEVVLVVDGPTGALPGWTDVVDAVCFTGRRRGPAAARNLGVDRARHDVVVFVDGDVVVEHGALDWIARRFADPDLAAVFGSYDDAPEAPGVASQYKNLLHHFVHHRSAGPAVTFWTGCGAVRREVFVKMGGFDEAYRRPSIEDIELGMRIADAGLRVELDPDIRGKHLKDWTLTALLVSDVRDRAIPWSRLLLERWSFPATLNLDRRSRVSAGLTLLGVPAVAVGPLRPRLGLAGLACLGGAVWLQADFYRFLAERRGVVFAVRAAPLHLLYHLYSGAAFAVVVAEAGWKRRRGRR